MKLTKTQVMKKLKECYDPEIPINIVDLGLVYDVKIEGKNVYIKMTLTSIGCPLAGFISEDIQNKIKELGAENVEVEIVWDPPWTPDKMSKQAKAILGI
ncbi:MAG: metal-sulfur cluster assembly factor [Candidatus Aenigmarchaeota archaeon]|nr:metal-sulfur cluster assembly factor [Candidatus Aenigmarchaeota archaeon]MBU5688690.1 metal-sulfur cluster assembly factor [Candidatus Aenigmarchaeota archaeon]